jgi:hypothetical protein
LLPVQTHKFTFHAKLILHGMAVNTQFFLF